MPAMTAEQRALILDAFLAGDPHAYCEPPEDLHGRASTMTAILPFRASCGRQLVIEMMHQGDIGDVPVT